MKIKLRYALSNCACFSPYMNKVVIFGGGFSSGFSHYVEMIDIETGDRKQLPKMKEGRDLRNKVVYIDGCAYAIGGLNRKCERLSISQRKWKLINDYIINDNLDSWSCAMMFNPSQDYKLDNYFINYESDNEEDEDEDLVNED